MIKRKSTRLPPQVPAIFVGIIIPRVLTPTDYTRLMLNLGYIDYTDAIVRTEGGDPVEHASFAAMRAQIEAGADGIITDYPTRLRRVLADLGMPRRRVAFMGYWRRGVAMRA